MNTKDIIKVVNANKAVLITTINELAELEINFSKLDQLQESIFQETFNESSWYDDDSKLIVDYEEWFMMCERDMDHFTQSAREKMIVNTFVQSIIPNVAELDHQISLVGMLSNRISAMKDNLITYFNVQLDLPNNIKSIALRNQLVNAITKVVKEME